MKSEVRMLLRKANESLILSVEIFNRPVDTGRATSVLILVDHAFEMLLKASILHRGGRVRLPRERETIGFDHCLRLGLSTAGVQFLTENQVLTLQALNGLRDAAQHYLLEMAEEQLYIHIQTALTLYRDLMLGVFGADIAKSLPNRVLPVSIIPPSDLSMLFDREVSKIAALLRPGSRKRLEAEARLRPLMILDSSLRGAKGQPSASELKAALSKLASGTTWQDVFPGVAAISFSTESQGPTLSLRIVKREGIPVSLVPEGTPGASVIAVRRVNELDYYSLGLNQLAEKAGLTSPKTLAVIRHLRLQENSDYFKEIQIGRQCHKRYSAKCISEIQMALASDGFDLGVVWQTHGTARRSGMVRNA